MDAALLAAVVAALATVGGFLLSRANERRERRARTYADALAALRRWAEVPYVILRRPAADAATRAAIGQEISESVSSVAFHLSLLRAIVFRLLSDARPDIGAYAGALSSISHDAPINIA